MIRSGLCSAVAILWSIFALVFLEAVPAWAMTIAKDGQPAVAIVLASDPIPAELQFPVDSAVDPRQPEQKSDVWARIKFEGPGFPHSQSGQKNAIYIERVVLVQYGHGRTSRN